MTSSVERKSASAVVQLQKELDQIQTDFENLRFPEIEERLGKLVEQLATIYGNGKISPKKSNNEEEIFSIEGVGTFSIKRVNDRLTRMTITPAESLGDKEKQLLETLGKIMQRTMQQLSNHQSRKKPTVEFVFSAKVK